MPGTSASTRRSIEAGSSGSSESSRAVAPGPETGLHLGDLGSGEHEHEDRQVSGPVDEMVEEVEQADVRVLRVLDRGARRGRRWRAARRTAASRRTVPRGRGSPRARRAVSTPSRRARRAATYSRSASATKRTRPSASFPAATAVGSSSAMPRRWRTISASAQNATPSPYERQRPRCQSTVSTRPSAYFSNSQPRRDLPTPAGPETTTRRGLATLRSMRGRGPSPCAARCRGR